jgi:protein tyrosine phosphatase (PTP) superfamily phosphohydrolase (DUF442 family)
MMKFGWLRGGRSARGTPSIRRSLRRHPFLLPILTLVILSQTGCQSGFFGPCGPCANGPFRRFRERIFNRDGCGGCGGGTVVSDVPIVEGAAPAVIAPAPVLTPGTTLPAPAEVSPQLESIPSATPGPASGSSSGSSGSNGTQGARAPTGKVNYEAARPAYRLGRFRPGSFPRTYAQRTPVPTSRSAQGSVAAFEPVAVASKGGDPRASELSLLDNLPPLDLPRDEGRSDIRTTAAAATAADPEARPTVVPTPVETTRTEIDAAAATPGVPVETCVEPGLRRFSVLEPKLAGGSLPSTVGLDWLAEKGYKTLVDLREPGEVQSSFLAEVSKRGMRYISLPISLATVDHDHINRFHFEISLADARPLYFFDAEGNRAGMLWYIQRMTEKNDSYDPEGASLQAEEIGLADPEFLKAAKQYLEHAKPKTAATPTPAPSPGATPTTTSSAAPEGSTTAAAPGAPAPVSVASPMSELPDQTSIPARPEAIALPAHVTSQLVELTSALKTKAAASAQDPTAWRPLAALLLTVLGIPAAYWSRSLMSFRVRTRASLPGPGRRLRSLPAASGE